MEYATRALAAHKDAFLKKKKLYTISLIQQAFWSKLFFAIDTKIYLKFQS
jgi:hypothetical protein